MSATPANTITPRRAIKNYQVRALINLGYVALTLDRTQPVLPIEFDVTEKRTNDYVRHGTTNLFAALNVATGEVVGECKPTRNGANFLDFLKKAVKPHRRRRARRAGQPVHAHHPHVTAWLERNPRVHFHFTPAGSSWINQIDLVRHHHPPVHPARHIHLRRPDQADPGLQGQRS